MSNIDWTFLKRRHPYFWALRAWLNEEIEDNEAMHLISIDPEWEGNLASCRVTLAALWTPIRKRIMAARKSGVTDPMIVDPWSIPGEALNRALEWAEDQAIKRGFDVGQDEIDWSETED